MMFSKLVLPAPEAPIMNVAWPGMAEPVQPFKICTLDFYVLQHPAALLTGALKVIFSHVILIG